MRAWGPVFIRHEGTAMFRLDSKQVEIVTGDYLRKKLFSLAARAAQVHWRECVGEDIRKRFVLFTIVYEVEMRGRKGAGALHVSRENRHKPTGRVAGQRRQQERV